MEQNPELPLTTTEISRASKSAGDSFSACSNNMPIVRQIAII